MASPYSNLQSKLERAVGAYLVSKQCGTVGDVFPFETERARSFPNTTIDTGIAVPDPPFGGDYRVPVIVTIRGSAAKDPKATNPAQARLDFDQRVALTGDYLAQTDDQQTLKATAEDITTAGRAMATDPSFGADLQSAQAALNNADMADFTVLGWMLKGFGKGKAEESGCDWEIVLLYEAYCCASAIN